ncbi:hypothetical protein LDENG_00235200 [Lucifuga dentata]|nr:hypothetical protein LDENG_00235200 [Lucifuga dentata]
MMLHTPVQSVAVGTFMLFSIPKKGREEEGIGSCSSVTFRAVKRVCCCVLINVLVSLNSDWLVGCRAMAGPELLLDSSIRVWVVLPIIFITFLVGIIRHYVSQLLHSEKKVEVEQVSDR